MDYSKTVNLLQTSFPMKADLPVREPLLLKKWDDEKLYEKIQKNRKDKPVFLLHDGPPYANGDIHMGHALNKILKDFVVKYKTMAGYRSPYKPGWDCHGLPIEHQLFKQLGKSKHDVPRVELRQKAAEYALGFVEKQKADFIRLGVLGEWDTPYLTLTKDYEAGIVETFFELWEKGFIYRGLKPGYWCAYDETALAEAEVEYAEKKSDSVYVRFKLKKSPLDLDEQLGPHYVLIWTTTPWTLPANTGLAFHPEENYIMLGGKPGGGTYVVAEKLSDKIRQVLEKKFGSPFARIGTKFRGKAILGAVTVNPLHGRESRVVNAEYVTMEDGTGIVHIAPGHGLEDFAVGQEYKLEVLSPVDERGKFTEKAGLPELVGKLVLKDANAAVMDLLGENLIFHHQISHSYPHCWRCKNPILFRATEQWFLRVSDDFRQNLLGQIDKVKWEPAHGVHRIKGMVETRPDWCLSRQRHWGAPIAVFFCEKCKEPLLDKALNKKILELIRTEGADAWYTAPSSPHAVGGDPSGFPTETFGNDEIECRKCGSQSFIKEMDILDVWFDSGVSWHTVIEEHFSKPRPETVLYLEGSDQHRGWFQTSLIPSVALRGKAPYDVVLTHGFVMDGKGHKMSKSLGNVIAPQEVIQKYGADILRLWVAVSDYREDVRLSQDILKHVIDNYRLFRNTFRFLLQNTSDFKRSENGVSEKEMNEVDRWILNQLAEVKARVRAAYDAYEFHAVLSELNRFSSVVLSGFYLDAIKDWLYCERSDSPVRRSAQTALYLLAKELAKLLAPILSFTAEEAYLELKKVSDPSLLESVFLESFDKEKPSPDGGLNAKWAAVLDVRRLVNDALDKERKAGVVKSSQGAKAVINLSKLSKNQQDVVAGLPGDQWPFILQMAEVFFEARPDQAEAATVEATAASKCERCWRHRSDVGNTTAHPTLCGRCVEAVADKVAT